MGRNILLLFLVCGIHQVFAARKKSILYLKSGLSRDIKCKGKVLYIVSSTFFKFQQNTYKFTPRLIVADLTVQKLIIRVMVLRLRLVVVKSYVTRLLVASTFHTALNGTTVSCAPNAISSQVEMQSTTHRGRGSRKVCGSKRSWKYKLSHYMGWNNSL